LTDIPRYDKMIQKENQPAGRLVPGFGTIEQDRIFSGFQSSIFPWAFSNSSTASRIKIKIWLLAERPL